MNIFILVGVNHMINKVTAVELQKIYQLTIIK